MYHSVTNTYFGKINNTQISQSKTENYSIKVLSFLNCLICIRSVKRSDFPCNTSIN